MVHGAALTAMSGPQRRHRLFEARRAVDDDQLRRSQSAPDEIVEQRTPGRLAFPAHALNREQHLLAVGAHASATSNEIEVALLSSRTRATVPSRISRTIGSSASERAFQASQSPFVLRQTRLTTSLPTGPANTAFNASHAAGVGPCEISLAIKASAARVRRW